MQNLTNLVKYLLFVLALITSIACSAKTATIDKAAEDATKTKLAIEFVQQLHESKFELAEQHFDSAMKNAVKGGKLKQIWDALETTNGAFQSVAETHQEAAGAHIIVFATSQFENALVDIKVVFDKDNKIAGLFHSPSAKIITSTNADKNFTEKKIEFGHKDWLLPGIVTYPKNINAAPLVILVHGSGPNDADSTIGPNKPFRDIAQGLAKHGVATLRYVKRSKEHGQRMVSEGIDATVNEVTVDDAVLAVEFAKSLKNINTDKIFVVGLSMGGMMMPRIAEQTSDAAGYVMMAANARSLDTLVLEQYNYIFSLDGDISAQEQATIDGLQKQISNLASLNADSQFQPTDLPLGQSKRFWLELKNYNAVETAKKITKPLLIAQGGRDYQVSAERDFSVWKTKLADKDNVNFKLYPELNHLMMAGKEASTPDEYMLPKVVDTTFINDLASWIKQH